MNLTQIATLLNETIVPNIFGAGLDSTTPITITEDLRNVVEIGKKLADMTADDVKNYMKDLAVGVYKTYCDTRKYKDESYGLFMDEIEYGGCLQRVKCKLFSATDTPILTLDNANNPAGETGTDYLDGKYWGAVWDSRIYSNDTGFQVRYSLSAEMFKKSFTSAEGVARLIAMIEAAGDNTLRVEINGLARSVLRKLALTAYQGSRVIPLFTTYNTQMSLTSSDPGYIDLTNWTQSVSFKLWVQTKILELRKYVTDFNKKYGNGDVETFCPEEDTRVWLLTEFAAEEDVALSSVYHKELVSGLGDYQTVNYWQNGTPDLLPVIASGSLHDQIKERVKDAGVGVLDDVVTIDHVVGIIADRESAFITTKLIKTTSQYNAVGDFQTMYHNEVRSWAVDPRNCAVILTLA